jgi:hypothetical protein
LWMDQCFGILELHQLADIKPWVAQRKKGGKSVGSVGLKRGNRTKRRHFRMIRFQIWRSLERIRYSGRPLPRHMNSPTTGRA